MPAPSHLPANGTPHRDRRGHSFRTVAIGGGVLAAVIVSVLIALYVRFLRYERVAVRHVPEGAAFVVRLDVAQAPLYEPVRRRLLPLLGGPLSLPSEGDARLFRIEERTDLHSSDLREVVVAFGPATADWVIVLGGIFPAGPGMAVLAAALHAESPRWAASSDGVASVFDGRTAIGRGRDATVVIASSEALLRRALVPGGAYSELGLSNEGAGALAATAAGVGALTRMVGLLPALTTGLTHLTGQLTLGNRLELKLVGTDSGDGHAGRDARDALARARDFQRGDSSPTSTLVGALADRAVLLAPTPRSSAVVLVWELEEVDQAFSLLADSVRDRWR